MVFIGDKFLFDEKEKEYIDELITNNCFPYFYQNTAVNDDHYPFLCHTLKFADKDKKIINLRERIEQIKNRRGKEPEMITVYGANITSADLNHVRLDRPAKAGNYWEGIQHGTLVNACSDEIRSRGWKIMDERFSLSKDGAD